MRNQASRSLSLEPADTRAVDGFSQMQRAVSHLLSTTHFIMRKPSCPLQVL